MGRLFRAEAWTLDQESTRTRSLFGAVPLFSSSLNLGKNHLNTLDLSFSCCKMSSLDMMILNIPSALTLCAGWWSYLRVHLPSSLTDAVATLHASRGCWYSRHHRGPRNHHLPLISKQCCFWTTSPAPRVRWNITRYHTQVLFVFVHLEVKTTQTDETFRVVLAPWICWWLKIKAGRLCFAL